VINSTLSPGKTVLAALSFNQNLAIAAVGHPDLLEVIDPPQKQYINGVF
jgi:hypothetical protein